MKLYFARTQGIRSLGSFIRPESYLPTRCSTSLLFSWQMYSISSPFNQDVMGGELPRLGEGLGIFDGVLDFEMSKIGTANALDHAHVRGVRNSGLIDPGTRHRPGRA